ncbi:MAG: cell division protein ZapA [Rhodospirillales bacterium]|jgi:cell division protein ZapA|nr:cell division protein ZapA [Rhodospirillales bacterium]
MAQVTITINERKYDVACDDGQEAHVTRLARYIDKRVEELVVSVGQVGDARLMVMASLLIADELSEVYTELEEIRNSRNATGEDGIEAPKLEHLALRIETIAEQLEET